MRDILLASIGVVLLLSRCNSPRKSEISSFTIIETEQGLEVQENNIPVLFFQRGFKESESGEYSINNYVHPLYDLVGDTLTEDFPDDHPYHRGLFWAWHQIYESERTIGDSWVLDNFVSNVADVNVRIHQNCAELSTNVFWYSPTSSSNNKPYLNEKVRYKVYPLKNDVRVIDIEAKFNPLLNGIRIGGANNKKGYGGLCLRLKLPDDLSFTAHSGVVVPDTYQLNAGSWMNFSGTFNKSNKSSVTLIGHSSNAGYPQRWILRQETSMQNIVFPGQVPVPIERDNPLVLKYRLLVHDGLTSKQIEEYEELYNQL